MAAVQRGDESSGSGQVRQARCVSGHGTPPRPLNVGSSAIASFALTQTALRSKEPSEAFVPALLGSASSLQPSAARAPAVCEFGSIASAAAAFPITGVAVELAGAGSSSGRKFVEAMSGSGRCQGGSESFLDGH